MTDLTNNDIFHLLLQKSRLIKKQMDNGLKEHNLYMSQWSILFALHKFGAMTQKEIWRYFNVEAPTITRTLERMETNGWIERKEGSDRRERIIVMTKHAEEDLGEIINHVSEIENGFLKHFTDTEKQQLYYLLDKING